MITPITIWCLIVRLSVAQLNGEFWWLNDRVTNYTQVRPPPPTFEELSEFDNDDSAKIVFRDDTVTDSVAETMNSISMTESGREKKYDENLAAKSEHIQVESNKPVLNDRFVFKFPEEEAFVWRGNSNITKVAELPANVKGEEGNSVFHNDNVSSGANKLEKPSENVCNFMKKSECYRSNGIVDQMKYAKKIYINQQLICCVLPLPSRQEYVSSKIYFPDDLRLTLKRRKRSNDELKPLKQRNILLQFRQSSSSRTSTTQRIATPDYEDDDPYWNIKTIKSPNKQKQATQKYDYDTDDYEEDYASEIPKPGLTGLYSDNMKPSIWSPPNKEYGEYSAEYDDLKTGTFGYSTVDPRRVSDSNPKPKRKPVRLTTTSQEISYDAESQTVSYQSKPNFNVFQDFKLLLKNKDRTKVQRRSTTLGIIDDSKESLVNEEDNGGSAFDYEHHQVYQDCGKAVPLSKLNNQEKQIGQTVNGSHPWLALVVPTRKRNSILCYATLIHPRAAITVAHCVYRKAPGEITLLSGIWDLNEIPHSTSRVASIRMNSKYKHGELAHNLAILHWVRPLEMSVSVQPACLADPHFGDECMFFGWGGFDQVLKRRPLWQRASVRSCKSSLSLINEENLPVDAFCTDIVSGRTVTGIGGALMCGGGGRVSAAGVAVSRDSTVALLPVHQWALAAMSAFND